MKYIICDSSIIQNKNLNSVFNSLLSNLLDLVKLKNDEQLNSTLDNGLNTYKFLMPISVFLECVSKKSDFKQATNTSPNSKYQFSNISDIEILNEKMSSIYIKNSAIINSITDYYNNHGTKQIGYKDFLIILELISFAQTNFSDLFLFISKDKLQIDFLSKNQNSLWLKKRIIPLLIDGNLSGDQQMVEIFKSDFFNIHFFADDETAHKDSQEYQNFLNYDIFTYKFQTFVHYNEELYINYLKTYIEKNFTILSQIKFDWTNYKVNKIDISLQEVRSINSELLLLFSAQYVIYDTENIIIFCTIIISDECFNILDNLENVHFLIFKDKSFLYKNFDEELYEARKNFMDLKIMGNFW